MIERQLGFLKLRTLPVSDATRSLEDRGFACLRGVLADAEIEALRTEVDRVFEELPPDVRIERRPEEDMAMFRYEMLNRSALCQHKPPVHIQLPPAHSRRKPAQQNRATL
jgi:hypothetical protein